RQHNTYDHHASAGTSQTGLVRATMPAGSAARRTSTRANRAAQPVADQLTAPTPLPSTVARATGPAAVMRVSRVEGAPVTVARTVTRPVGPRRYRPAQPRTRPAQPRTRPARRPTRSGRPRPPTTRRDTRDPRAPPPRSPTWPGRPRAPRSAGSPPADGDRASRYRPPPRPAGPAAAAPAR